MLLNCKINTKIHTLFTHPPTIGNKICFLGSKHFHKMEQRSHFTMILQLLKHVKLIQHNKQLLYIAVIILKQTWLLKCIFAHRVQSVWHGLNHTKLTVTQMDKLPASEQIQVHAIIVLNTVVHTALKEVLEQKIRSLLLLSKICNFYHQFFLL